MNAIAGLPNDVRLEIYDAIVEYGLSGTIGELKPMATMAINFVKNDIDRDRERYDEAIRQRVEAGKRSAEARKATKANGEQRDSTEGNERQRPLTSVDERSSSLEVVQRDSTEGNERQRPLTAVNERSSSLEVVQRDSTEGNYNVYVNDYVIEEKEPKGSKKKAASAAERAEVVIKAATDSLTEEVMDTSYPNDMKEKFIAYWTEPNKSRTRVRYQMEKTWDTSRRLALWASRDNVRPTKASEIGRREFSHNYDEGWE